MLSEIAEKPAKKVKCRCDALLGSESSPVAFCLNKRIVLAKSQGEATFLETRSLTCSDRSKVENTISSTADDFRINF